MERYRRRENTNVQKADKKAFKKILKKQTIVCAVIFCLVFLITLLKTETAEKFTGCINQAISYTVDYRGTVTDIVSKIKNFAKEVQNVSEAADFTL